YLCVRFFLGSFDHISKSSLVTTVRASPDRGHANDGVRPRRSGQARTDQLSAVVPLPLPLAGRSSILARFRTNARGRSAQLGRPDRPMCRRSDLQRPLLRATNYPKQAASPLSYF